MGEQLGDMDQWRSELSLWWGMSAVDWVWIPRRFCVDVELDLRVSGQRCREETHAEVTGKWRKCSLKGLRTFLLFVLGRNLCVHLAGNVQW
jgi:hypothetical protein